MIFMTLSLANPAHSMQSLLGATPWVDSEFAETRLLSDRLGVDPTGDGRLLLGWEIKLPEGWKTYWRSPGEAGLPTTLSWEGSENIADATLYYPLPARFEIFGIQTYGYDARTVLPVRIKVKDPSRPVYINATANFMVCMDICVPLEAKYQMTIPAMADLMPSSFANDIQASLIKVPRIGRNPLFGLDYEDVRLYGEPGNQRLVIDVVARRHLAGADVIVEAGKVFRFGTPSFTLMGRGNKARFVVPVGSGRGKKGLSGQSLTLTLSDGWGQAVEVKVDLAKSSELGK